MNSHLFWTMTRTCLVRISRSSCSIYPVIRVSLLMMVRYAVEGMLERVCRQQTNYYHKTQTVKFRAKSDPPTITQQDSAISSIKSLISTFSGQVVGLEQKISELTAAAKLALGNKNRISALSALRSKKLAEYNLNQRLDTLAQLEEVYASIDRAAGQVDIVQVMESSAEVLRALHMEIGGTDRVERVVEDMREEIEKTNDIGDILADNGPTVDESEIDEELEAMEKAEKRINEDKEFEETVKRLAEIDKAATRHNIPEEVPTQQQGLTSDLEDSIGRLSDLSIEEGDSTEGRQEEMPAK